MDSDSPVALPGQSPSMIRWTLGFLLVGIAWGGTTPFMRRAAINHTAPIHPTLQNPNLSRITYHILRAFFAVTDLLRHPAYAIPFLINVTGSIWFFLLIGQAELSLTVPITNSLAFLCTVFAEWWAEGKVVGRDTWLGMSLVLAGIALCVHSKT